MYSFGSFLIHTLALPARHHLWSLADSQALTGIGQRTAIDWNTNKGFVEITHMTRQNVWKGHLVVLVEADQNHFQFCKTGLPFLELVELKKRVNGPKVLDPKLPYRPRNQTSEQIANTAKTTFAKLHNIGLTKSQLRFTSLSLHRDVILPTSNSDVDSVPKGGMASSLTRGGHAVAISIPSV